MPSITLKDIPEDLHAQLKQEATANFRSLPAEAVMRIQRSFEVEDRLSTDVVNRLMDEAIASGSEELFSTGRLRKRFDRVKTATRRRLTAENKPA